MSELPPSVPPSTPPPPGGGSYAPPPPPPLPPLPPAGGAAPNSDRTVMLVLSYLGILALIPLIIKKDDREVQWHAKNGLALTVAYIIIVIVWAVVQHYLPSALGCALTFVGCALWVGYIALMVFGIMKALKGERLIVPGISDFADKM